MKSKLNEKNILGYIRNNYSKFIDHNISDEKIISIYWFDNNMKNIIFPWILKIERELKTIFVYYFKKKYKGYVDVILNKNNYNDNYLKVKPILNKVKRYATLEEYVFSLTYGEFVKLCMTMSNGIYDLILKNLNIHKIDSNFFENILIVRNNIAHNLSLLSINELSIKKIVKIISSYLHYNDIKKENIFLKQCEDEINKIKKIFI